MLIVAKYGTSDCCGAGNLAYSAQEHVVVGTLGLFVGEISWQRLEVAVHYF